MSKETDPLLRQIYLEQADEAVRLQRWGELARAGWGCSVPGCDFSLNALTQPWQALRAFCTHNQTDHIYANPPELSARLVLELQRPQPQVGRQGAYQKKW